MRILSIETSCDETAIAIAEFSGTKTIPKISVLSNIVSSQIKIHQKFGGVVPNLARREHERNLPLILIQALKESGLENTSCTKFSILKIQKILEREPQLLESFKKKIVPLGVPKIDTIAVTYGPGLAPALWVGVNFAKALSVLWNKPLIPINHMSGHFYSALLQPTNYNLQTIKFPALGLLVSGGHTELVYAKAHGKWKILGETRDDAAGEVFDKVARILGLPYPGGPQISALAEISQTKADILTADIRGKSQRASAFMKNPRLSALRLPRPMIHSKDYDFSFSGLKTAVLYLVNDLKKKHSIKKLRPAIAKEFQNAVVDVLVKKTIAAAKQTKVKTILLGGGVAANQELRKRLIGSLKNELPRAYCLVPNLSMTGDNALMIAIAAHFVGKKKALDKVGADANVRLRY